MATCRARSIRHQAAPSTSAAVMRWSAAGSRPQCWPKSEPSIRSPASSMKEPVGRLEAARIPPDCSIAPASRAPRDLLLLAGEIFGFDGPAKAVTLLQALPVGGDVGPEIFRQSDVFGEPQRIADDDIGRGEPIGAQRLRLASGGFRRPATVK